MPEVPRCAPETLSQLCFSKICILIKNKKWLLFFLFLLTQVACGILVPQPRTQPEPPAVETWSPNHRTTREVPDFHFFKLQYSCTVLHKLQVYNMYMLRCFSGERLFAAPGTVARQAPLCMGFSRQEFWGG